jgi:polysaccharide biosynthesis protein VpsM
MADPLLSFGPDIPLFITASASVRYDDNVLLSPTDKVADTIYLFAPGVDLNYTGGQASAGMTFSEQFSRYVHYSGLDDQLANLTAHIMYQGAESSFGATGSYVQTDQTTTTATSLDQTVKQTLEAVGATAEVALTAKIKLGVTPSFDRVEFPENGYTDSDIFTVPVDLYYGITPKTDLSVGYAYNHTTTANGTGDSKGNFFNVGARGQFTEKLSGQVRVGVTEQKPEVGESTSQLGLGATLNYAYSPKTTFSLYANNGFAPSAAGNETEVFSTGLSGSFLFSPSWSATFSGGMSQTKYLTVPSRTDHFWDLSLSLTYIVTSSLDLQASYLYRKNVSTLEAVTFDDNLTTLTAACRF